MELKPYQQKVINDLAEFISFIGKTQQLDIAYKEYWNSKGVNIKDVFHPDGLPPYKAVIKGVPHVAMKVPTAGGKTFIASNALRTIFEAFPPNKEKVVVWLVPSITILDQTFKNLNNSAHPYRQKLDTHFQGKVDVFLKEDLLQGTGFNSTTVKEQLSILVLSYDSFRTKSKEGRKAYQENENLTSFFDGRKSDLLLENSDEISLVNAIRSLNPIVIVDESHNAESELSVEMLNNFNPCFVLDLTATPRANSNIISFVDSLALKKENMVKLPVLVYNHHDINEVITSSVELRHNLELSAKLLQEQGGDYIRPIVLFQAQPKNDADNETFDKVKEKLVKKGIPEEEIAIKTANKNDIKGVDLLSPECKVRYIITVNALKEGWDCPFAYILASLANRSSKVEVEQILGRILRQPYTKKLGDSLLNMSYVFTASQNFHDTLESIVAGLNKSGFSRKDFRVTGEQSKDLEKPQILPQLSFNQGDSDIASEIDDTPIILNNTQTSGKQSIIEIIKSAKTEENEFEEKVAQAESDITWGYTDDLAKATNFSEVKDHYKDIFKNITLPQFYLKLPENSLFNSGDKDTLLSSEYLLDDEFELKKQNTEIDFDAISLEVYQVDIEESGKKDDYTPKYKKLSEIQSKAFLDYINSLPEEGQITQLTDLILNSMGRMEQFADSDMRTYIRRVIEDMDNAERTEIKSNPVTYAMKIKKHIEKLAEKRTEDVFSKWIDTDKVFLKYEYILPKHITPTFPKDSITKSLYVSEQDMNTFESEIITQIASLENVVFWHKIIERKGFFINGFINHYPDFLIYTKSGKIILLETKGDHLDGSDAVRKLKLGRIWANKAGINYRYFMVFKENPIKDAHFVEELMNVIKEL